MTGHRRRHYLFVCSRNQWRSPTAERLYRDDPRIAARSVGLSASSTHRLNEADLNWADVVLVMEDHHKARIKKMFGRRRELPRIEVLGIPDEYPFMDRQLIEMITQQIEPMIERDGP